MMDMDGNFPRVTIGLTDFEKHGEVEFITTSINILGDVRASDGETKDRGDVVL